MRRRLIAAAWISGATVPAFLATVFVFGCCILPFHKVMHKLMPICDFAASIMRGEHGGDGHDHEATAPEPARERKEPVKRFFTTTLDVFRIAAPARDRRLIVPDARTDSRSFIALGAMRCDQDIGLYVFVETFLI